MDGLKLKGAIDGGWQTHKVWGLMKRAVTYSVMEAVCGGDEPELGEVKVADVQLLDEMGRMGHHFVETVEEQTSRLVYEEWWTELKVGKTPRKTAACEQMGALQLLTLDTFVVCVDGMMRRKAVGVGGLLIQLVQSIGGAHFFQVYTALMQDVRSGCLPEHWRTVLYVLLPKPPPNDVRKTTERREIPLLPHDFKLLLYMIRKTSYKQMETKLDIAQCGWKMGRSAVEPGLGLNGVIQDVKRWQAQLWVLYIELATFFPNINRDCVTMGELMQGLPVEMAELTLRIFGRAHKTSEWVQCRYESAGGLSSPFANWMGWWMGWPLSPVRAKLLINSIIVAINCCVRGVKLDENESGNRGAQLVFGDDWMGMFEKMADVHKVWGIWNLWARITASKLGVKGFGKTVLTAVRWVAGKAMTAADPGWKLCDGRPLPFMGCEQVYKHLGVLRRLDGDDEAVWQMKDKGLQGKMQGVLHRLRQVKRRAMTRKEFVMVSDVLIGGGGGYSLASSYISWEQAEQIEAAWRRIYSWKFNRELTRPRAELYRQGRAGGKDEGRIHLWCRGLAALKATVDRTLIRDRDTPVGEAVRKAVAVAMQAWGCRVEPRRWQWKHLMMQLEDSLRRGKTKWVGEAWMLATVLCDEALLPAQCEEDAWSVRRWRTHGRWKLTARRELDVWLGDEAEWARAPNSLMLFEPVEKGGLGCTVQEELVKAGVVAVGQMTAKEAQQDGGAEEGATAGERKGVQGGAEEEGGKKEA